MIFGLITILRYLQNNMDPLQLIFIIALLLGIAKGYYQLCPPSSIPTKEPDIYFVITDIFHK